MSFPASENLIKLQQPVFYPAADELYNMRMTKTDFETLVVLFALITLVNAAPVRHPEGGVLETRDFDCTSKRELEGAELERRQCGGGDGSCMSGCYRFG
jgi:hypothetical protein